MIKTYHLTSKHLPYLIHNYKQTHTIEQIQSKTYTLTNTLLQIHSNTYQLNMKHNHILTHRENTHYYVHD